VVFKFLKAFITFCKWKIWK